MGVPYGGGRYRAEEVFSFLPDSWQQDPYVQNMYSEMMSSSNWSDSHTWHDYLQEYINEQYGEDFDDHFDWQDWRDNYNQHAA